MDRFNRLDWIEHRLLLLEKGFIIMAGTIEELRFEIVRQNDLLTAESAQIDAAIGALETKVAELEAQIGQDLDLTAEIDLLKASNERIAALIPDPVVIEPLPGEGVETPGGGETPVMEVGDGFS